jgi:NTE family protein
MKWLDRLFHHERGPGPVPESVAPRRIGLALGGGGVRGAAHLGVLSVFEREGIAVDVVAGTSVGAVVGAGVAAGVPPADMLARFLAARWTALARPSWGSKLSMLEANPMGEILTQAVHAETFDDLVLPLAVVASDILTGTRFCMTEGSLREAIIASTAIPGFFEPVRRDGRLLVDGGLTDNLPVRVARELGADFVIAVDIMPPLDGSYAPQGIGDMLLLSWNIVQRTGEIGREHADFVITPGVAHVSIMDFAQAHAAYDAGVVAAEKALPALLAALGRSASAG